MNEWIKIGFIGLISGVIGTGAGGLMAFFINKITNRMLSFILEFSAGLMTAVVCFELIPEAFEYGGTIPAFLGIIIGILTLMVIEDFLRKSSALQNKYRNNGLLRAGILMSVGIALHNFPEGFAVGSGFEASLSLGVTLTAVIMIHDVPEGIAIAVPLKAGGMSKGKAFLLTVLSGIPMGLGAFLGAALGGISKQLIGVCLGFAGGAMLYVVFADLIPESKKLYLGRLSSLGNILGIICGIIVSIYND